MPDLLLLKGLICVQVIHCFIIARESNRGRQKDTVENQIAACKALAKMKSTDLTHFVIAPEHIQEDHVSAHSVSITDRPAVQALMEAVRASEVSCLLIKSLSRFCRDETEAELFRKWLEQQNVRILTVSEMYDSADKATKPVFKMHSMLAQMESDKKSIDVKVGMLQKVQRREWKGGTIAFGLRYDPEHKKIGIHDAEAAAVLDAFTTVDALHVGPSKLADKWNQEKKYSDLKPTGWSTRTLREMLSRRAYIGEYAYQRFQKVVDQKVTDGDGTLTLERKKKREIVRPAEDCTIIDNFFPAIVPKDLFYRVQAVLDGRKKGKLNHSNAARFPLTGLLRCHSCGRAWVHGRTRQYGYYICSGRVGQGTSRCNASMVKDLWLHEAIAAQVLEKLRLLRDDVDTLSRWKVTATKEAGLRAQQREIRRELEAVTTNLAAMAGTLPPCQFEKVSTTLAKRIQDLEVEVRRVERELYTVQQGRGIDEEMKEKLEEVYLNGLDLDDTDQLRAAFHYWLSRVEIFAKHREPKRLHLVWKDGILPAPMLGAD